jgi:putative NADH-flavin reductase
MRLEAMKILVLGASGGVGKHLVRLACEQGHMVTALARRADSVDSRAHILIDDVLRPGCFDEHVGGHEVVLSALGIKRSNPANPWSALASPPDFCSSTAARLVKAMRQHGLARVIAVSAAGVADSAARLNLLMKFFVAKSNVGIGYRDLARMERVFAGSGLDWCCPRPTRLTNGRLTRRVKTVEGFGVTAAISRADVAWWDAGPRGAADSRTHADDHRLVSNMTSPPNERTSGKGGVALWFRVQRFRGAAPAGARA